MEESVVQEMLEEFDALREKVTNLKQFILDNETFSQLDPISQDLLISQLKAMETYLSILSVRIGLVGYAQSQEDVNTPENVEESENIQIDAPEE